MTGPVGRGMIVELGDGCGTGTVDAPGVGEGLGDGDGDAAPDLVAGALGPAADVATRCRFLRASARWWGRCFFYCLSVGSRSTPRADGSIRAYPAPPESTSRT